MSNNKQQKPKEQPKKLRILALHGYYQSGDIFHKKTGAFRTALKSLADFVYVTAPNQLTPEDMLMEISAVDEPSDNTSNTSNDNSDNNTTPKTEVSSEPVFKWWGIHEGANFQTTQEYLGLEKSIEFIKEVFRTQGPFDGILGFSQGGVFASILCGLNNINNKDPDNPISFKFAIIVSAFAPSPVKYVQLLRDNKQHLCPTLHTFGKKDTLIRNEWSTELASWFPNPVVVEHDGGHYIPVTSGPKQAFRQFLTQAQSL